mgnify:CR=1 FL=1
MSTSRIALYIGNELYPGQGSDPDSTIKKLHASPLTSPILSLLNQSAADSQNLVYNQKENPLFNTSGDYLGDKDWPRIINDLRNGGNIQEVYLSFSSTGTEYMGNLLSSNKTAAMQILTCTKNDLGLDGIDIDYEYSDFSNTSPLFTLASAAIEAGLKLTAAPFMMQSCWQDWVNFVQKQQGTVSWLNLQCYAGGKTNNPGDWLSLGVPIVAGSCPNCANPQTTCTPDDMQALFTLWRTGQGSVPNACWSGTPNTSAQTIGGGFIWAYGSISDHFSDYMNALKNGLGM